jgi:hypothetical protein
MLPFNKLQPACNFFSFLLDKHEATSLLAFPPSSKPNPTLRYKWRCPHLGQGLVPIDLPLLKSSSWTTAYLQIRSE